MNSKIYVILTVLSLQILWMGCGQKSDKTLASSKSSLHSKTLSNSKADSNSDTVGPYDEILSNDIFMPPDMRHVPDVPPPSLDTVPEIIEPQKLTITGIVFDGNQYLVSVENLETGDQHYLKPGDYIAKYPIVTIDFDTVKVQDKKKLLAYGVGDEIPLPGTRSLSSNVSTMAEDSTVQAKDTTGGTENGTISSASASAPSSGDSLEETLRKRRQQEEEKLK
jgi:hypothetical protein